MGNAAIDGYLEKASDELPTIPKVALQVIEAIDDEDSSVADIRVLIEQDPALATRILKASNSSLYSFASEIRSVDQAMSLLGGRTVRNLVMAVAMRETYANFGELEQRLWEHASAAGPVAAALARRVGHADVDEAFTAGLIHDIGKTALANSHRDEFEAVTRRVEAEGIPFTEAEQAAFGFDHAELGAHVAKVWELPETLVSVIRCHHDDGARAQLPEAAARLTALVSVTTACLTRLGVGRASAVESLDLAALPTWQALGLGDADVDPVLEECAERIEAAGQLRG